MHRFASLGDTDPICFSPKQFKECARIPSIYVRHNRRAPSPSFSQVSPIGVVRFRAGTAATTVSSTRQWQSLAPCFLHLRHTFPRGADLATIPRLLFPACDCWLEVYGRASAASAISMQQPKDVASKHVFDPRMGFRFRHTFPRGADPSATHRHWHSRCCLCFPGKSEYSIDAWDSVRAPRLPLFGRHIGAWDSVRASTHGTESEDPAFFFPPDHIDAWNSALVRLRMTKGKEKKSGVACR